MQSLVYHTHELLILISMGRGSTTARRAPKFVGGARFMHASSMQLLHVHGTR